MKELKVSAIKDGTVIDHIPASETFNVVEILNLQDTHEIISIASNLKSTKTGMKGMIKIGGKNLSQEETNKIAIIVPNATINIIKNYQVMKKYNVALPDRVENIVKCFNPNCITNKDDVKTKFTMMKENPLLLRCDYCERVMRRSDIKLL